MPGILGAKVACLTNNGHAFRTLSGSLRMSGILRANVACLADQGHTFRTLSGSLRMLCILKRLCGVFGQQWPCVSYTPW